MVAAVSRGRSGRALAGAAVLAVALGAAVSPAAAVAKRPARADLSVRSATAKLQSGRVTVTLVAANGGRRAAAASSAHVTWKPVGSPVVTVLRRFRLPAIRARARRTATVVVPVPTRSSGAYGVSVCLNVRSAVRETRRGNNCRAAGRVTVPAAGALGEVRTSAPMTSGTAPAPAPPAGPGAVAPPAGGGGGPDVTPPETTIGRGPVGTTTARTETFMFSASEAGSTFECRLDGGDWTACVSPLAVTALPDGVHTFEVRGTDAAGNTDASPASRSWTVDGTAPETLITAGPPPQTGAAPAGVEFAASEAGSTFECRLDGGAWTFCSSPHEVTGLAAGPHTLQVRATDPAGNRDATPASRAWTVDLAAPQTTIDTGPEGTVEGPDATFAFSASEAGATFACRLDGGDCAACAPPLTLIGLADGEHTFQVAATDAFGNADLTPATRTWTVAGVPAP